MSKEKKEKKEKIGIIQEFKEFAIRGNMIDLAVGVVIGAAFNAIVQSFITNMIDPIIGALTANENFSALAVNIGDVKLTYGAFISSILNFILIALTVFVMVKVFNKLRRSEEEDEPSEIDELTAETEILTEIRDILKESRSA